MLCMSFERKTNKILCRKQFGIRGGGGGVGWVQTSQKRKLVATGPVDEPVNAKW